MSPTANHVLEKMSINLQTDDVNSPITLSIGWRSHQMKCSMLMQLLKEQLLHNMQVEVL